MQKALQSIAMILIMALSAGMFTGCVIFTGKYLIEYAVEAAVDGIANAAEEARYKKAVEIVIQYDEIESF